MVAIVVTVMMVIENLVAAIWVCLAVGSISLTITKSVIFSPIRDFVEKRFGRDSKIDELFNCSYCMSHWVALFLVGISGLRVTYSNFIADFIISWFAVVSISTVIIWIVYRSFHYLQISNVDKLRSLLELSKERLMELEEKTTNLEQENAELQELLVKNIESSQD